MNSKATTAINKKQREFLRRHAQKLKPVIQIGKHALSNELLMKVETELITHELIKIKVLDGEAVNPDEAASRIAELTGAAAITRIGKTLVLFRENEEGDRDTIRACGLEISRHHLHSLAGA